MKATIYVCDVCASTVPSGVFGARTAVVAEGEAAPEGWRVIPAVKVGDALILQEREAGPADATPEHHVCPGCCEWLKSVMEPGQMWSFYHGLTPGMVEAVAARRFGL